MLACAKVDCGAVGEGENGSVVTGLVDEICLGVHCVSVIFWMKKGDVQSCGLG